MLFVRNGSFRPLNKIDVSSDGTVTSFLWPSGCCSFYVYYLTDTPVLHGDSRGIRSKMKLINFWLRFKCGGFNTVWDCPIVNGSTLLMVPMEVMEMAVSYGHSGDFDRESDENIGRVEIHAPAGCNPMIYRWVVNYTATD